MSPDPLCRIEIRKEKDLAVLRLLPKELAFAQRLEFGRACQELLASGCGRLAVDLTRVQALSSVFVGTLADLGLRATDAGQSVTILASPGVAEIFRKVNLASPLNVRVAEKGAGPSEGTSLQAR